MGLNILRLRVRDSYTGSYLQDPRDCWRDREDTRPVCASTVWCPASYYSDSTHVQFKYPSGPPPRCEPPLLTTGPSKGFLRRTDDGDLPTLPPVVQTPPLLLPHQKSRLPCHRRFEFTDLRWDPSASCHPSFPSLTRTPISPTGPRTDDIRSTTYDSKQEFRRRVLLPLSHTLTAHFPAGCMLCLLRKGSILMYTNPTVNHSIRRRW